MSCQISELNGVKIYNFSAGKTMPEFLDEAKKKHLSLRYNQEFRQRLEVIQGFEFNTSCNQLQVTNDQQYIMSTGVYAPTLKIYETQQLSEKCSRGIDSECVKFCMLTDDYSKIAMAQFDRNIEVHAQYGRHYRTRIPKMPRDIVYQPHTCDLLVAATGNEIYRLSLDEGQFLQPFESLCQDGVNTIEYNKYLNIAASGAENGIFEVWDYRQRKRAMSKIMNNGQDITCLKSNSTGLQYGVGSSNGLVRVYDVRYENHLLEIKHHYKQPINTIDFHEGTKNILSSSKRILKINSSVDGQIFTNIEPPSSINMFQLVPDTGMILMALDQPKMGIYFVPQLDKAPKWVPFLENLTEEMEEKQTETVYEEFKFVTQEDLEQLEATNLIGTKMLKQHLHGYLMHMKLYQKLQFKKDPFSFAQYEKEQIERKIEKQRQSRIKKAQEANNDKVKVNEEFLKQLKLKEQKGKGLEASSLLQDDRFGQLFKDENFKINENTTEYKQKHTSTTKKRRNSDEMDFLDEQQLLEFKKIQEAEAELNKKELLLKKKKIAKKSLSGKSSKSTTFQEKLKTIKKPKKQ